MDIQQTKNDLLDAAVKKTGLDDFGADTFNDGLDALLYSVKHEANLNFRGKVFMHDILLIPLLINRLHVCDWVKRHPEILDEKIEKPVFVIGLPRSGTTLFHNLLALDPTSRFLANWEAQAPCPPPELINDPDDPRIQAGMKLHKWLLRVSPELKKSVALHLKTGGPEECHRLLQHEFKSKGFALYFHIPGYLQWLSQNNLCSAYEYHHLLLQLLQWHCPNERWVLKAPAHMIGFQELLDQYPDARIIFLHRDPAASIPSGISMTSTVRSIFSDTANMGKMANHMVALYAGLIQQVFRQRERIDASNIYDIQYADLVKEPVAAVRGCYKHFGLRVGEAHERRMDIWLCDNPQHKHGKHKYSLDKFGLDLGKIRDAFGPYINKMNIPSER